VPKLLKVCFCDIRKASRNLRELSAAKEAGYEVAVLAEAPSGSQDNGKVEFVQGWEVHWYAFPDVLIHKPVLFFFSRVIRFALSRTIRFCAVRAIRADVLSCHDIQALFIGYLSTLFYKKGKKPLLVYDAHEYELGRKGKRGRIKLFFLKHQERYLIRRCAFSITVNDSIADEMQRVHRLRSRPVVVRNTPENWLLDSGLIAKRREELLARVNEPGGAFFVMNHGGITPLRGIDNLIRLVGRNTSLYGIIMGYVMDDAYLDSLLRLAREEGAAEKMVFLPAVEQKRIWEYAGAADVALILIHGAFRNHYWSLPNKFFENIQSLTPIICSHYPEMKRIVEAYGIGLTCDPDNLEEINACIEKMRTDKAFYTQCKENLRQAKEDLCWENEKRKLIGAYTALQADFSG